MEVKDIQVPSLVSIRVSKEGKSVVFETTVVQTTDNKYIYVLPVRVDGKLVNFEGNGMLKNIMIEMAPATYYEWRNVSIIKFAEKSNRFLRIKVGMPGVKSTPWLEPITTTLKKKTPLVVNIPEPTPDSEEVAMA
jgi:hypothetical protein